MPQPTNNELFQLPDDRVLRLEFLPYPAVSYEEHFNTNFLLSLQRFSLLVQKVLGPVKTDGYDVVVDGTDVVVRSGLLFFREFLVNEDTDVTVDTHQSEDRNLILKITEVEKTYESHQSDIEVSVEGRSLSGPNQQTYQVEYLYQTAAVPADTATEKYLLLAEVKANGDVVKQVPARDELLHELETGEKLITDENYKSVDTQIANFFNNKRVDYGSGDEVALFVDPEEASIVGKSLFFRVEKITPMTYIEDYDSAFSGKESLFQSGSSNKCKVEFSWGYKTNQGNGGNGTVTIDNAGFNTNTDISPSFSSDELAGYRVWVDGTFYRILGNDATSGGTTLLNVEDFEGNSVDLSGVTIDGNNPVVIDNQASEYKVIVRNPDGTLTEMGISERESGSGSPVKSVMSIEMEIGRTYAVSLKSFSKLRYDDYTQNLPSAGLTQWGSETLNYSASPSFVPEFANIPSLPSATLTDSSKNEQKMIFTVSGVSPSAEDFAEAYEVVWNINPEGDNSSTLDFSAGNHDEEEIIFNYPSRKGRDKRLSRDHQIPRGETRDIHLKYRAIVGNQIVSSPGEVITTMSLNDLPAPNNLSVSFLAEGLWESISANDFYGSEQMVDANHNPAAVKINFDAVDGARGYQVESVALDNGGNSVEGTRRVRTLLVREGSDDIGSTGVILNYKVGRTIRITVSTINPDSSIGESTSTDFMENPNRLEAPDFDAPSPDETGITISWNSVDGADHYEILWSLSGSPQLTTDQAPQDQEQMKTKNTKMRINAQAGAEIYVAILSIDRYGRRSLDMSRLQTKTGRLQQEPDLKVWAHLGKLESGNNHRLAAGDNVQTATQRYTQPVQVLGFVARPMSGFYYESGTTSGPADADLVDQPAKIRLYRINEESNNISLEAGNIDGEVMIGTTTDYDRDPLFVSPANTTLVVDIKNEHSTYDLVNFTAEIFIYYKFSEKIDEESDDFLRLERRRFEN